MHKTQFNVCVLYEFCNIKLESKKKMNTVFNYIPDFAHEQWYQYVITYFNHQIST